MSITRTPNTNNNMLNPQQEPAYIAAIKMEYAEHKCKLAATDEEAWKRAERLYKKNEGFKLFKYTVKGEGKDDEPVTTPPPVGLAAFRIRFGFEYKNTKEAVLIDKPTGKLYFTGGLTDVVEGDLKDKKGIRDPRRDVFGRLTLTLKGANRIVASVVPPEDGWEYNTICVAVWRQELFQQQQEERRRQELVGSQVDAARQLRDAERKKSEARAKLTEAAIASRTTAEAAATLLSEEGGDEAAGGGDIPDLPDEAAEHEDAGAGNGGLGLPASSGGKAGAAAGKGESKSTSSAS